MTSTSIKGYGNFHESINTNVDLVALNKIFLDEKKLFIDIYNKTEDI